MQEEVLRRIEECRRTRSTFLDLSGLGLEEIPVAVGKLNWLEVLYLDNNQISAIQGVEQLQHHQFTLHRDNTPVVRPSFILENSL